MTIIIRVKLWDIDGEKYLGGTTPCLVDEITQATRFDLCTKAWDTFSALKGLGNVQEACLVEVD